MSNESGILFSSVQGLATITLNRPEKCNALNAEMISELLAVFQKLQTDDSRVILLQAKGEHFCAGADITAMQQMAKSSEQENTQDAKQLAALLFQIYSIPKPVIVAVQGSVFGGGIGLMSAGDIVLATKTAIFSFSEMRLGISPSVISPYVIAAIGERLARYYFLTAKQFAVEEAQRIGLVHQMCDSDVQTAAQIMAQQLLKFNSSALAATKHLSQTVGSQNISEQLIDFTVQHLVQRRQSAEGQEGLAAFLEKRTPEW